MKKILLPITLFVAAAEIFAAGGTVCIEMERQKFVSILAEPVVGKCEIVADESGNVRWRVFSPFESLLIVNGRGAFRFEKISGQWRKLESGFAEKVRKIAAEIAAVARGEIPESYAVRRNGKTVVLVPKSSATARFVKSIRIELDGRGNIPRSIEFEEPNGDKTVLKTTAAAENPPNAQAAFDESDFLGFEKK